MLVPLLGGIAVALGVMALEDNATTPKAPTAPKKSTKKTKKGDGPDLDSLVAQARSTAFAEGKAEGSKEAKAEQRKIDRAAKKQVAAQTPEPTPPKDDDDE